MADEIDAGSVEVELPPETPQPEAVPLIPFWSGVNDGLEIDVSDEPEDPRSGETEEFKELSREDIINKLQEEREKLGVEQKRADEVAALREGITQLGENLRGASGPAGPAPQAPAEPVENEEDLKKRLNEGLYDTGIYDTMVEFQRKKLGPVLRQVLQSNLQHSRKYLELDPERRETFKKYAPQIEDAVKMVPEQTRLYDLDVYTKAHDQIISMHSKEIIEDQVSKLVEAKLKELGAGKPSAGAPAPPFSETSVPRPPTAGVVPRKGRLTKAEAADAYNGGISNEDYFAFLQRHPERRRK